MTQSARAPRIAVLGGGNGIPAVLEGLAQASRSGRPLDVTAIVATADDGGSSGRIRRDRGGLPPGDVRNCLLALADRDGDEFRRLFAHRYAGAGDLAGHSLGNLLLMALAEQEGCWLKAVEAAARLLRSRGRVVPVTESGLKLEGETVRGERISGESRIGAASATIRRVWLDPSDARPSPGVLDALRRADLIVCGPGSLFTSLLPVLLVPGVADAVRRSRAFRLLIANLMTQPGETLGMTLGDHLEALDRHVGPALFEAVVVNADPIPPARLAPYFEQGARLVVRDGLGHRPEALLEASLVNATGKIRHDPSRTAELLLRVAAHGAPAPSRARSVVPAFPRGGSIVR